MRIAIQISPVNCKERAHLWNLLGFSAEQMHWAHMETDRYNIIEKPRGPGRPPRVIYSPPKLLKQVQKRVNRRLLAHIPLPECVHCRKNRSIVSNAWPHVGKECVATFDLRDFFPSIEASRVRAMFRKLGYSKPLVPVLTKLTTADGRLQQGLPTSTGIANLLAVALDNCLLELCGSRGLEYTRYVDDITISGSRQDMTGVTDLVVQAILDTGFSCSLEKQKVMSDDEQQKVTGLVVNSRVEVTPAFENDLSERMNIFRESAPEMSSSEFIAECRSLEGRVQFVRSVNQRKGSQLLAEFRAVAHELQEARLRQSAET